LPAENESKKLLSILTESLLVLYFQLFEARDCRSTTKIDSNLPQREKDFVMDPSVSEFHPYSRNNISNKIYYVITLYIYNFSERIKAR
jgi:hypothetical protein